MNRSESIGKVVSALIAVQSEMENVVKGNKNPFFKSNYADINALREEALPVLNKHKLVIVQPPTHSDGKNFIETIVMHESGEFISSLNEVIVAKQNDPQAYLAAQTYTRRGALQAFLCMGAVDDDGNFASGKAEKLVVTKKEETKPVVVQSATPIEKKTVGFKAPAKTKQVEDNNEDW